MDPNDLRQAAIELLERSSSDTDGVSQQSPQQLIHELRVHQVELEMQNEELRRAQLELEDSRDRYVDLFDFAPVGYVVIDASDRVTEANLTFAKLLGTDRTTLIGQTFNRYATSDDATRLHRHLREVTSADSKIGCELALVKSDASHVQVRLDSICVGDQYRSITITDLSQHAELARAKKDSDERLRVICHALPIPIAYADQNVIYQFNNAAHEQWFELSREAIAGRHIKEVIGQQAYGLVKTSITQALAGHACSCRLDLPARRNGLMRPVEVHYAPYRDDRDMVAGIYELMFDLSVSRRAEVEDQRRKELGAQLTKLSKRQRTVFDLLMTGKSNKTIALGLDFGMRTVERERHDILKLLGVGSINEMLVKFAGHADCDEI